MTGAANPRLVLLCQAATSATRAAAFPSGDEPLEMKALRKAGSLERRFAGYRCVSSSARSATASAAALGLTAVVEPALADCDYGAWAGRSLEDVHAADPEGLAAWFGDPEVAPHGGESTAALIERVGAWLDQPLLKEGRTLAITHASVIRAAVLSLLGAPASAFRSIDIAPLSVTELSGGGGRWVLKGLNAGL